MGGPAESGIIYLTDGNQPATERRNTVEKASFKTKGTHLIKVRVLGTFDVS